MKTILAIIEKHGGIKALKEKHIKLIPKSQSLMPLVIEFIGEGPRNMEMISVAHYYEQNGDLMADPELMFEIDGDGKILPVGYQQDNLGIYQVVVRKLENGSIAVNMKLQRDLNKFAEMWDKNIKEEGFLDLASENREGL